MPSSYPENTPVFVLATPKLEFATMVELASGKQLGAYAFTSQEKAKKFMKIMREHEVLKRVKEVLPCTLKEWFNWQPTKNLPDLIIDIDPRKLRDEYNLIQADPAKYNITCILVIRLTELLIKSFCNLETDQTQSPIKTLNTLIPKRPEVLLTYLFWAI